MAVWLGSIASACSISAMRKAGRASKDQISLSGQDGICPSVSSGKSCGARARTSMAQRPGRICTNRLPSGSRRAGRGLVMCMGIKPANIGMASVVSRCSPETLSSSRVNTWVGTSSISFLKTCKSSVFSTLFRPFCPVSLALSHSCPSFSAGVLMALPLSTRPIKPVLAGRLKLSGG